MIKVLHKLIYKIAFRFYYDTPPRILVQYCLNRINIDYKISKRCEYAANMYALGTEINHIATDMGVMNTRIKQMIWKLVRVILYEIVWEEQIRKVLNDVSNE